MHRLILTIAAHIHIFFIMLSQEGKGLASTIEDDKCQVSKPSMRIFYLGKNSYFVSLLKGDKHPLDFIGRRTASFS